MIARAVLTRLRITYVVLAFLTILTGLGVHMHAGPVLGIPARDFIGDALWGMMIVWWISALLPRSAHWKAGLGSLATCYLVEFSQLVHVPWLDQVRHTFVGHLFLGSGFDPRDLVAYLAGVTVATLLRNSKPENVAHGQDTV